MDLDLLDSLLEYYGDREVVQWLRDGWPISRIPGLPDPFPVNKNHDSAVEFPETIEAYISKRIRRGHIIGPFQETPFKSRFTTSPLNTVPKRNSTKRRVILDLSYPVGHSVNDGILKDNFMGFHVKLKYPTVDALARRIFQLGENCYMFKLDLEDAFRQLPLEPWDHRKIPTRS